MSCRSNTNFETYLSSINASSQISSGKYGVRSEASTAATTAKISMVESCGSCIARLISMGEHYLKKTITDNGS
jgi:hypothetical protein